MEGWVGMGWLGCGGVRWMYGFSSRMNGRMIGIADSGETFELSLFVPSVFDMVLCLSTL